MDGVACAPCFTGNTAPSEVIHAAHAAATTVATGHRLIFLRRFSHHRFGGDHRAGDRCRVLQGSAGDLGRVQDAHGDHVAVLTGRGVVAVAAGALLDLVQHHRVLFAAVGDDLAQRGFHGAQRDGDAVVLGFVGAFQASSRGAA